MENLGYLEKFRHHVEEKGQTINKDSREGEMCNRILDIFCEHKLMAYEGIAILEKCALEIIAGSKIRRQ